MNCFAPSRTSSRLSWSTTVSAKPSHTVLFERAVHEMRAVHRLDHRAPTGATRRASLRTPSASGGAVMRSMSSTLVAEQADCSAAPSPYGLGFASQPGLGRDERPRWRELVNARRALQNPPGRDG